MIIGGAGKKLTIYIDETDRKHGKPVYELLLDLFLKRKMAGASVFRGIAGYGSHGKLHTSKILELSSTLPLRIDVVDSEDMIRAVLPEVTALVEKGLIEVSDTNIIMGGRKER